MNPGAASPPGPSEVLPEDEGGRAAGRAALKYLLPLPVLLAARSYLRT